MKSHALLRTNVDLTTNVKLIVTSNYRLYIESIDSVPELNVITLKKFGINKNSSWDFDLSKFWDKTPAQIAFSTKFDSDVDLMYNDFSNQYDSIYYAGARNISNNKGYVEEFEYFAPLHIQKKYLPTHFIIFRIDGPGLQKMTKENFRNEFLNKMKCVKVFDLTTRTDLGEFLNKNFTTNNVYKDYPSEISFSELYSSINGIKYPTDASEAGYTTKYFNLDFKKEYYFHEIQKDLTKKFQQNGIMFSNIMNFSFLFDDTPATPTSLRKWSINRYSGFYFDKLELVTTISPTVLPSLKDDVSINRLNIIESQSSDSPFLDEGNLNVDKLFVNVDGLIYKVKQIKEASTFKVQKVRTNSNSFEDIVLRKQVIKYKIMSDISLEGKTIYSDVSNFAININYQDGENKILNSDGTPFNIPSFEDSDVWLIEIGGEYFKLIKNKDKIMCLYTDYAFKQSIGEISYYINDPDPKYKRTIKTILDENSEPVKFNIYKCQFTDIKDFDNDIVETDYAKYEYELDSTITKTEESKLYLTNLKTGDTDDFKFGSEVTYLPASSEYTANNETFRINLDYYKNPTDLNDLWRKNPNFVKWGYRSSICSSDYPYLLNNSLLSDPFNRSTNFIEAKPIRVEKNLDYFLSINSKSSAYTNHSLHVEDSQGGFINTNFKFELDKYLGINYSLDYFTYFFGKRNEFFGGRIIKNTKKWSYILGGDEDTNNTVFRGLKFILKKTNSVSLQNETVSLSDTISVSNTYDLSDYKFAILLSNNEYSVNPDPASPNHAIVTKRINTTKWRIIEDFKTDKVYSQSDVVIWQDMLFQATIDNSLEFPSTPASSDNWSFYNVPTIFWNPNISNNFLQYGGFKNVVFNYGQYYYLYNENANIDFWNPDRMYLRDDMVIYRGSFFKSLLDDNIKVPSINTTGATNSYWQNVLEVGKEDIPKYYTTSISDIFGGRETKWKLIKEWNPTKNYNNDDNIFQAVTYDQVLYGSTSSSFDPFKFVDTEWIRMHSFKQDTNVIYGPTTSQNNIVRLNGEIYECVDNTVPQLTRGVIVDNTLDDGINIYINKKFKNVLVNIYVNDNTLSNAKETLDGWVYSEDKVKNVNRDDLYERLLYKFTASNFLTMLKNPFQSYGFSDKLRYIVIEESGDLKIYDFNNSISFKNLPYILLPGEVTPVSMKQMRKIMIPYEVGQNILKPTKVLPDGIISTKRTINYYTDLPVATNFSLNQVSELQERVVMRRFPTIYRHSGQYSPIFKEIQLFRANTILKSYDNYKFDTELSDFGMTGEQIISKINRSGSILKLKDSTSQKSIYPMLDEFGYHVVKRFIFKSNWDFEYHHECVIPDTTTITNDERTLKIRGGT